MSIYKKKYVKSILIVIITIFLSSCAAPKVRQNVLMPANSAGLQSAKKLSIINFSGDKNDTFSHKLNTFFTNLRVQNKPYFTVIDQDVRDSILAERKIQIENGTLLGNNAVKFGKLSGADTLISGHIQWPVFTNKTYKEERTKCIEKAKEKSKGLLGIKYRKCIKETKYMVNCNKMSGTFNFTIKAVSVRTGTVIHTKNYGATSEDKHCKEEGSKSVQKESSEFVPTMMNQAISKMRSDVAPYMILVTIELMDDDDSDLSKNKLAEKLFESGIEFAENKRMKRACDLFDEASKSYEHSPAIFHNLGVCAEMTKNFDLAASFYQKADRMLEKPEKLISAALVRVDNRRQKENMLQKQLR